MGDTENSKKRASAEIETSTSPKKPRTFRDDGPLLDSAPVAILVGESEEKIFVYASVLESSSEFFRKALNKEWKEGHERVVRLPDASVSEFKIYAIWLYTGRFYSIPRTDGFLTTYVTLVVCYELGDFLRAPDFLDAVVDILMSHQIRTRLFPIFFSKVVYHRSGKDSLHWKLCQDIAVQTWDTGCLNYLRRQNIPREFVEDVLLGISEERTRGGRVQGFVDYIKNKDAGYYHEHTRLNTPCYKTKYGVCVHGA